MAIVVSCIASDPSALAAIARRQEGLADLVELRLDRIGHPGKERLAELVRATKKPVIVACPGPEAFGSFEGGLEERLALLHDAAELGARFVDVDWRLSLDLGELPSPAHRIVSRHETEGTPGDLDLVHEEVAAVLHEGDVTKIVAHAETCEDGLRLLSWLRTTKGVVAFSSGEVGRFTRVLAPIFGSPFTYCAPAAVPGDDADEPTAPGQLAANDLLAMLPPGGVSQETAVFGVVGRPVAHSLSPWVQGMALKAARLDAVYQAFEPRTLAGLLELATDENYRGFSVTAPFKEEAFELADSRDQSAERCRAANTLVRDAGGWRAANTDVRAVRETLEKALEVHARANDGAAPGAGLRVLVLGAGGAARAAAWAVLAEGGRVTVAGRTLERARRLAEDVGCESVPWDSIPEVEHDVLVHATPVGSMGAMESGGFSAAEELALPVEWIRPGTLVLDAVYRPIRTPLLLAAHARGCTPIPGGEWFVRQAAAQFELFTREKPDVSLMRHSFESAEEVVGPRT